MPRFLLLPFALTAAIFAAAPLTQAQTTPTPKSFTQSPTQAKVQPKSQPQVQPLPSQTPLVFEPNRGQAAPNVQWLARGSGFSVALTSDGATIEFHDRAASQAPAASSSIPQLLPVRTPSRGPLASVQSSVVQMHLSGGNAWKLEGVSPTGGTSNYLIGNKPANWHTGIPQYAQAKASGVYSGIDLAFHGNQGELEYDFVVAPGADPRKIQLHFAGAASLRMDKDSGELVLTTSGGKEIRHQAPKIYQQVGGKKVTVKGGYEVQGNGMASFTLGTYDNKLPLVIDPTIIFTTFLAGSDTDEAFGIALDGLGNSYVTGYTYSNNFPVVSRFQDHVSNSDAFVTKLSPSGSILFSTYLGGGDDDTGDGIAVDPSGVYVVGQTHSSDFPLMQAYQPNLRGDADIFVTKLSLLGDALVYSTYLGGSNGEQAGGIAVDASQSAYVAGFTQSTDFPIVGFTTQTNFPIRGGFQLNQHANEFSPDGFVAKFSPAGTSLVYSTYLGGSQVDSISAIAVDSSLFAYVTGETCSTDFPYAGLQSNYISGGCGAFVTKLSPAGDSVIYSTILGETSIGTGVAVDPSGNAYVSGSYCSPCSKTSGSFAFAAKLSTAGKLNYLVYLNGTDGVSDGYGIAIDADGEAFVVGSTTSTTFPGAPPATPNPTAGFLVKLDKNGVGPLYTVLLGAAVHGVAVVKPVNHLGGVVPTYATIFTAGYRFTGGTGIGNADAFVVKLDEKPPIVIHP